MVGSGARGSSGPILFVFFWGRMGEAPSGGERECAYVDAGGEFYVGQLDQKGIAPPFLKSKIMPAPQLGAQIMGAG